MIRIAEPVRRWTREVGELRFQVVKNGRAAGAELIGSALTLCDALLRDLAGTHIECDRLRDEVRARAAAWDHLFGTMTAACVLTDAAGAIVQANRPAATLLNLSAKALKGRQLVVFAEDRKSFEALLHGLAGGGGEFRGSMVVRPRDRRPAEIAIVIVPLPDEGSRWLWFLEPAMQLQRAPDAQLHCSVSSLSAMGSPEPM